MFLFICTQLWAAEPTKEVQIASVNQPSTGSAELGSEVLSSFEVEANYGLSEKLSVLVSYGYGGITTNYDVPSRESANDEDYYYQETSSLQSLFAQHMISAGARYSYTFNEWASIYGKVEGNVALQTLDFAPSIGEEDPISKISSMGMSFGGTLGLGVMGSIQLKDRFPDLFVSFEAGYRALSPASFDTLGDLDVSGGYSSLGCGVRF